MFYQKNFLIVSEVIVASGFASIHLVKYAIATTANLFPLYVVRKGRTKSIPHICKGHVCAMSCVYAEGFV